MLSVNCGVNGLKLFPGALLAVKACRTEAVLATITVSGPAAARRPFFEATVSSEAVGGGRASLGHGEGSNRSFASPAIVWKPRALQIDN